jgi:hypothetical protein
VDRPDHPEEHVVTAARRGLVTIGAVGMGYAVLGALTDADIKPFGVLIFLAGVLVAHDAILLPMVIGVGAIAGRFLPGSARTPVRVASVISLAVCVVALPLVLGYGRSADNPSALPLAYGTGLVEVLAAVWGAALLAVVVRARRDPAPRTSTRIRAGDARPERPPESGRAKQ